MININFIHYVNKRITNFFIINEINRKSFITNSIYTSATMIDNMIINNKVSIMKCIIKYYF